MKIKKYFLSSLLALSAMTVQTLSATAYNWTGTGSDQDLTDSNNWNPVGGPPTTGDTGSFGATANTAPFLDGANMDVAQFGFDGTTAYTLRFFNNSVMAFSNPNTISNSGVYVSNLSSTQRQTFNIDTNSSSFSFVDNTSADASSSGLVDYHIQACSISFSDSSNAGKANFLAESTSQIEFNGNSSAANSVINISKSDLLFSNNSNAASAAVTADSNSRILFFNNATGSNATVVLSSGSYTNMQANNTLASIASADADTAVNFNGSFTVGSNNASTTFAGVLSDKGGSPSFIKVGTGTLTLTNPANNFNGPSTIQAGELKLNGNLPHDALVKFGALLSGTGIVDGTLTVEGTIAPGNSIGTFNVAGNYVQSTGSTYFLEIDGAGNSDLINVTGAATLNGGQVVVTSLDAAALLNTPYPILTAAGGVSGQFAGVSTTNLLLTPSLIYDANNAYLVFSQAIFNFDAVTPNQIAVATQLENITDPTAEELLILNTLAALTPAEQQAALNQMSGEQYASLNLAAEIAGRQFIRRLYDPLRSIVTTEPCNDCCCACPCPTLDVWFEAGGGQTFLDGNSNAHGYKMSGYEVTAGIQSTFNCDWTLGIAGSYAEDRIKYDIGNNGKNRMGFVAAYGLYRPSNFYVLADLAFGGGQFIVNRSIDIGDLAYTTKGRPNHYQGIAYIEAGFDWNTCSFLMQPFLGFEGGYFRRNSISETGTSPLNLDINRQSYGNAFSRLGVHLTTEQWSALKLSVDVAWDCRLTSTKRSITENFQEFGDAFAITGIPGHRNSVDVAVTGITKLCGGWELYLEAGGEFWSKVSTYNVLGGVKYSW